MDVADLVGAAMTAPGQLTRPRAAIFFLVAGALWLGLTRLLADDRLPLTVHIPAGTPAHEVERLIDEAVLVEAGLGLGWQDDPLMRDRANRIAVEAATSQPPLVFAANLDLPRRDPLMRARLIDRARRLVPEPPDPTDAELETLLEHFQNPPAITFEHRFTRDPTRAPALLHDHRGEAELTLGPRPTRTLTELARSLSPAAAERIFAAPPNTWTAIASPLGHHAVRVLEHHQSDTPPLEQLRPQLRATWRTERRELMAQRALDSLRARFDIELVTLPSYAQIPSSASR